MASCSTSQPICSVPYAPSTVSDMRQLYNNAAVCDNMSATLGPKYYQAVTGSHGKCGGEDSAMPPDQRVYNGVPVSASLFGTTAAQGVSVQQAQQLDSSLAGMMHPNLEPMDWDTRLVPDKQQSLAMTHQMVSAVCKRGQQSMPADVAAGAMLYGQFSKSRQQYSAVHPNASNRMAAAHPQGLLAADRALRAQHYEQQQLLLLRQQHQQQQQQQALQRQQAEAAAVAKAQQQQQQLLLMQLQQQQRLQQQQHHQAAMVCAAAAAAVAPAAAAGRSLYGHFCAGFPSQQADAVVTARCMLTSSNCQSAVHIPQQVHQQGVTARLPPHPATVSGQGQWALQQQQDQHSQNSSNSSRMVALVHPGGSAAAAAAPQRAPGRWCAVAVMESPLNDSQDSDAGTGGLECDEELQSEQHVDCYQLYGSREGTAGIQQQLLQQHLVEPQSNVSLSGRCVLGVGSQAELRDARDWIDESGSTQHDSDSYPDDMDDGECFVDVHQSTRDVDSAALVAAKAAAVAAEQAAAAKQSVVLHVLGKVASLRKGGPVLTATSTAADVAGAQSVRPRLLITEVSLYTDRASNSMLALDQANKLLANMVLPDNVTHMPVLVDSFLFKAGAAWQFPAFVICLGSSYLQRMLSRLPQLAEAALACPGFEDYCSYLPEKPRYIPERLTGNDAIATLATLRSVQFTCLFLATKVADQVHALGLLRFMLTNLSHNGDIVSMQQAADVEARCLDALGWRLGPFFLEDELQGNDEILWAEGMGHWDYGTQSDTYLDAQ
eukprot:GHRR01000416.1.p1 GENE.GHRR01000416.1~~GHRR01000416.1.p1  ORF type:complete len:774 (+),score=329.60 GHRR01000416.1:521-2842(+)